MIFESEDGSRVAIRPSGTEPKIKMYISVNSKIQTISEFKEVNLMLDAKLNEIVSKINLWKKITSIEFFPTHGFLENILS